MSTKGSVVIQDLTYTEKNLSGGVTISYTNGAVAGSEVVSVSGFAITIQINSGVSTATQIKAAVLASYEASQLVSVTISGTGSNVQKTCKLALLSGGVPTALKATLTINRCLVLTAHTAGVAGNSTRFKFTTGATAGSEVVTVSTADISVQIAEGVSTYAQVAAALVASGAASALVDCSFQLASSNVANLANAPAYIALSGGADVTNNSKAVQDITYSCDPTVTTGSISYTTGASAGSEVVTNVGSVVTVQIANGSSTATQIKAAMDAKTALAAVAATATFTVVDYTGLVGKTITIGSETFTEGADFTAATSNSSTATSIAAITASAATLSALNAVVTLTAATAGYAGNSLALSSNATASKYTIVAFSGGKEAFLATITGTGSTAQKTVNAAVMANAVGDGAPDYYQDAAKTALTSSYVAFPFGFVANNMTLACDEVSGAKGVNFSFDGITQHGSLLFGQSVTWARTDQSCIWLKYVSGAPAYRLMVQGR